MPQDSRHERGLLLGALLKRRIVLVTGLLTEELATAVAAQIMTLDAEDDEPLQLHIASPDGDLGAALVLADTVGLATAPVTAFCRGALGGPALAPFAAAPRRVAAPHATFRMSEPHTSLSGRADEIAAHAAAIRRQLAHLHGQLALASGQPAERIAADMEKGRILTADEARDYGLVHEITGGGRRARPPTTDA
ncbi:MAG: ATP-dependent Clp protease proteolytic subunit [Actinomycetota bacterium]|nr:ATP-dependent Clp protease proteolytic subunit [Actinomycetota bacterium]